MTAPVFVVERFVEQTEPGSGGRYVLDGPEGRHAVSVKRLQPGEDVILTDGAGRWADCVVLGTEGKDRLIVQLDSVSEQPAAQPRITVVQALPKGDRGELAVETMTEVGVDAVVPWQAARCITQWKGERGLKSLGKWRPPPVRPAKQSRRLRFPEIADAATTKQVAALLAEADFAAVLHSDFERGRWPLATAELPDEGEIVLVVGPEGGVAKDELTLFEEAGARAYVLGPTVLRTSTAGTAAAALLLGRTGRWS